MDPGVDIGGVEGAAALRDLVLMVREDKVRPAAVDVELVTEVAVVHRRALDVPARTPLAPRRIPLGLAGLRHLPEHEVIGIVLALLNTDTGAGAEVIELLPGEPAVLREAVNREHHVAVSSNIGVAVLKEPLHDADDAVDVLGRVRLDVRAEHAEGVKVAVHLLFHARCK